MSQIDRLYREETGEFYPFRVLRGNPQSLQRQVEILQRPGVNGTGIRRLGVRGMPFELASMTDFGSMALARFAYENYIGTIGAGAYKLIWQALSFTSVEVAVLGVRQESIKAARIVGGIHVPAGDAAILKARWSLIFLNPPIEEE